MENKNVNVVINENKGLVYKAIKKYNELISKYDLQDDMIQTGMISLYKAFQTFDNSKGIKFSTYATNIITNDLYNFVNKYLGKYVFDDNVDSMDKVLYNESGDREISFGDMISYEEDFSNIEGSQLIDFIKREHGERALIILSMINEGYNYAEIGEYVGISKQRVGTIIKDIRKSVTRMLEKTM